MAVGILGTGAYLPEQLVTNEMLSKRLGILPDYIQALTGIRQRHRAAPGQACSDLAIEAARQAQANAGSVPEEIGMVIVNTSTGDYPTPATAAIVQGTLGIPPVACFDLSAACSAFVYALAIGCHAVECGFCNKVLLVASEIMSHIMDPTDPEKLMLSGDGAGAVVIGTVPDGFGLLASDMGTNGTEYASVLVKAGGTRLPASHATIDGKQHYAWMDSNRLFAFGMRILGDSALRVIEKAGLDPDAIDLYIPHQASRRLIEAAAARAGLPLDRYMIVVDRYGNTASASIPIALHDAVAEGRLRHGDRLVMTGFGGGLSWGSALLRWYSGA